MILDGGRAHLTYCSNIHRRDLGRGARQSGRYVPSVRDQVAGQPFGVGLRLSAQAAAICRECRC
jgi:hypothetical protein